MFKSLLDQIRAHRKRKVHRKLFEGDRKEFFEKIYKGISGPRVLAGPFQGMAYLNTSDFGPIAPKWLGSYEMEIQDLVGELCKRGYESIVNIGSAEGYYAVGFARAGVRSRIFAFDIDPFARRALAALAEMNGVADRVEIRETCTWSTLNDLPGEKQLLFVDIEGAEIDLLDPVECGTLRRSDLIVELHHSRNIGDDVEKTMCNRFEQTHNICRRQQTDRSQWLSLNRQVWDRRLSEEEAVRAMNEFRTANQVWLWMESKL
jgi:precorrin-6B methylase 2